MAVEIACERRMIGLVPLTPADELELEQFKIGAVVKAKITRHKSIPMLRFYWATIEEAAEGLGKAKEELSHELLVSTKRVEAYMTKRNEMFVIPRRISKMTWKELADYVDAAMNVLFSDYLAKETRGEVFRIASQKARTTYEEALRALQNEGKDG